MLRFEFKEAGKVEFLALYNLSERKQEVDLVCFKGRDVFEGRKLKGRVELPGFSFVWAKLVSSI